MALDAPRCFQRLLPRELYQCRYFLPTLPPTLSIDAEQETTEGGAAAAGAEDSSGGGSGTGAGAAGAGAGAAGAGGGGRDKLVETCLASEFDRTILLKTIMHGECEGHNTTIPGRDGRETRGEENGNHSP